MTPATHRSSTPTFPRELRIAAGVIAAMLLVALLGYAMAPTLPTAPETALSPALVLAEPSPPPEPLLPPLATGEAISWTAATHLQDVERQVGPLAVRIARVGDGDAVAPSVELRYGDTTVRMEGERVAAAYDHRVTAFTNRVGAPPVVMLQSYSGGAHCCNHIQVAGLSAGRLKVVDLGSWDGEKLDPPTDLSNDGVADIVLVDQAFLYTFAPFAMSESVPKILNIVGGKVVDVSTRPAFKRLFVAAAERTGPTCRDGEDGTIRNGACAAYLAASARTGRLETAWAEMLTAYDATVDWVLPTGCGKPMRERVCAEADVITYQSYPEALLAFLKRQGYVARGWQPPTLAAPLPEAEPTPADNEAWM